MDITIDDIQQRYELVMEISDKRERNQELLVLMDLILTEFGLPLIEQIEWDREHPDVLEMYRKLVISRSM